MGCPSHPGPPGGGPCGGPRGGGPPGGPNGGPPPPGGCPGGGPPPPDGCPEGGPPPPDGCPEGGPPSPDGCSEGSPLPSDDGPSVGISPLGVKGFPKVRLPPVLVSFSFPFSLLFGPKIDPGLKTPPSPPPLSSSLLRGLLVDVSKCPSYPFATAAVVAEAVSLLGVRSGFSCSSLTGPDRYMEEMLPLGSS